MNVVLRLLSLVLTVLYKISIPLYWLKARGDKKKVSELINPLLHISATDLAEKIRKKEVTSEEVCLAYIKRIKEVNPLLNAVVEDRFESALQDARNVDTYLKSSPLNQQELEKNKPLLGVPLTVKESCSLEGMSLCGATLGRLGIKAHKDGQAVAQLKSKGAIPLLVSNTPEICLSWESNNFVTGKTSNPYDITRTSGASSGGEGALLGSGASLIGMGSDIAGSIRLPAMFNGIFGHKPTARSISIVGHYPNSSDYTYADYLAIGPMVRYAKDLKLMMKVMAEESALGYLNLDKKVDLSQIKVYFMTEEGKNVALPTVQTEIKNAVEKSVEHLGKFCKSEIKDLKFTDLRDSCEIAGTALFGLKDIPNLLKGENQNLVVEVIKSLFGLSKYTFNLLYFYTLQAIYSTFVSNEGYKKKQQYVQQIFTQQLGQDGVFLYPTFTQTALWHNSFYFHSAGISYMMIFNALGLPATNVPCGFDKNGLPIGIQVVAAPYQDRLCFAVAEELEKAFGGWQSQK